MKFLFISALVFAVLISAQIASAGMDSPDSPGFRAADLSRKCSLEARNSLIHRDMALVEKICGEAIQKMEEAKSDKKLLIDPLLNLSLSYTLAGQHDKAAPLSERARRIGKEVYQPGSSKLKDIETLIEKQEHMRNSSAVQKSEARSQK